MKTKVLVIITTDFVPYGGLTTVMMNYYRAIDKEKFHIDFASTNKKIDESLEKELERNNSHYFWLGDRKKNIVRYYYRLSKVLKREKYDVVHVNSNSATAAIELWAAQRHNVKKRIVHNHTSKCDHLNIHKILYPIFKNLYTQAIACSLNAGNWIFKDGNYTVLNNSIDAEQYKFSAKYRSEIRSRYAIPADSFVIGHVGKIYKPKNHHYLIEIFEKIYRNMPTSYLLLVGDGEMREEIEEDIIARKLQGRVVFAGMQSEVKMYLSAMDCFVFPSFWEGMPLSLIEAQASGLPCFASDKIDSGANITGQVVFESIDTDPDCWASKVRLFALSERAVESCKNIDRIKKRGYDNWENAKTLELLYQSEQFIKNT